MRDPAPIRGRWTINWANERDGVLRPTLRNAQLSGPPVNLREPVEVVPVPDEAAIERAARWLHGERFGCSDPAPCGNCLSDVREILRIAHEGQDDQ
jgi:hypothetical protein